MDAGQRVDQAGRGTAALLAAGMAAPILAWGLSVPVMLTWPGYDPIAQSISLLANAPQGWLQTTAFVVSGALGLAWAAGLGRVVGRTAADRRRVWQLFTFQSVLTLAFAVFPTDADEVALTLVGRIHLLNFGLYAVTMPMTLVLVGRIMGRDPRWAAWARPTLLAGTVLLVSFVLVPVTIYGPLRPWLGLLERIFVAIPSLWEVAVSLAGLRRISSQRAAR